MRYKVIHKSSETERGCFVKDTQTGERVTPLFEDEMNPKKPWKTKKPSARSKARKVCRGMNAGEKPV